MTKRCPVYLASTPWGEPCAQVGQPNYELEAKAECEAFKAQIRRHYKDTKGQDLPNSVELVTTANPHDYGTYYIVVALCDENDEASVTAAYWLESNGPELWDAEAKKQLWSAVGKQKFQSSLPF